MKCPICGSNEVTVLKSKELTSHKKQINDYLLKCKDCEHVFKDRVTHHKPIPCRLIVSENEKSTKTSSSFESIHILDLVLAKNILSSLLLISFIYSSFMVPSFH